MSTPRDVSDTNYAVAVEVQRTVRTLEQLSHAVQDRHACIERDDALEDLAGFCTDHLRTVMALEAEVDKPGLLSDPARHGLMQMQGLLCAVAALAHFALDDSQARKAVPSRLLPDADECAAAITKLMDGALARFVERPASGYMLNEVWDRACTDGQAAIPVEMAAD